MRTTDGFWEKRDQKNLGFRIGPIANDLQIKKKKKNARTIIRKLLQKSMELIWHWLNKLWYCQTRYYTAVKKNKIHNLSTLTNNDVNKTQGYV